MTTLFDDDISGLLGVTSDISQAPSSGIGLTKPASPRELERQEIASMGTGQKVISALDEVGAAFRGRPSPLEGRIESRRKEKLMQMAELKGSVAALEQGISMVQGVEGAERDSFVTSYADRLEKINPGMGETFKALAKRPDLLTQFKDYAPNLPEPMRIMMKSDPKGFLKFAGTAEGMKALTEAKDRKDLGLATKKVQTAMMGLQQFVPPEKLKGIMADNVVTASEVLDLQQHLPDKLKLSDAEIQTIQRNDKVFWQGLGVLHGDEEQKVLADRAKKAGKPADEPKTQTIAGKVYQWDPEKTNAGVRLKTDPRYVELGPVKEPGKEGGIDPKTVETELKVSDDYRQDSRKFGERRPLFDSATDYMAKRTPTTKTSAGDSSLMFAYAKMRDPNDRLAVSETRDLVKLGNIFERFGVSVTGILEKGETLPDRVAKEMYAEIRRAFTEQNRQQLKLESDTERKVKAYGGDPSRVVRRFAIPEKDLAGKGGKGDEGGEERKTIGNVTYVKKNGQWYEERK